MQWSYFFHPLMEISKAKIKVSSIFTVRKHVRSTRYHTMCSGLPYAFGTQNDTDWCINVESGETWHRLLIWVKYRLASLDRIVKSSPSTAASFVCLFIFSSSIFFSPFPSYRCRCATHLFHSMQDSLVWWKEEMNRCTDRHITGSQSVFYIISVARRHNSYTCFMRVDGLDAYEFVCGCGCGTCYCFAKRELCVRIVFGLDDG